MPLNMDTRKMLNRSINSGDSEIANYFVLLQDVSQDKTTDVLLEWFKNNLPEDYDLQQEIATRHHQQVIIGSKRIYFPSIIIK